VASAKFDATKDDPCPKGAFVLAQVDGKSLPETPAVADRAVSAMAFSADSQELVVGTCESRDANSKNVGAQYEIVG
jgi:hypothetical protein